MTLSPGTRLINDEMEDVVYVILDNNSIHYFFVDQDRIVCAEHSEPCEKVTVHSIYKDRVCNSGIYFVATSERP